MNKKNNPIKLFIFFSLFMFSGKVFSQDIDTIRNKDLLKSQDLDEVVVTASRFNSQRFKTPEAIEVLRSKSIQQYQLRSTPEALMLTPGVFVQKTNHGGGSPFLRGLTGNQTLLLLDGIRLSNSTMRYGPNQYLNTIDVFSIDKIEVLRGNGSVQYGSDAIGGTIQVFSPNPEFTPDPVLHSNIFTRLATHGMEQSLHAGIQYTHQRITLNGGISWRNFGDIVGGDTTGRQTPTGYKELDFDLKGKILFNQKSTLSLAYQRVHQQDIPVYHKIALENYDVNKMEPQMRQLAYLRLNQQLGAGLLKQAVFTLSAQKTEEGRESHKKGAEIIRFDNDQVRTLAFAGELLASKGIWFANTGAEAYNDLVESMRTDHNYSTNTNQNKRGLYPDNSKMTSIAIYTLHTLDFSKWNITVGARYNTFVIRVHNHTLGSTRLTPSALLGNVGVLRKLGVFSNVFVSLNTGFRAPNIDDLGTLGIVDFRYETPNFSLRPENSFQYQVGYKLQKKKLKGEVYLYRNHLQNLIVRSRLEGDSIDGYPVYSKENVESAYIQGVESAFSIDLNNSWAMQGNITYTFGQNITRNEPARRIPPIFGRIAATYKFKLMWFNLEWQAAYKQTRLAQGDRDDNRIPEGGTPGWDIFNFHTRYSFRFVVVDLSIKNLMNADYRYHGSGVNGYGRSAFLSATVRL